VGGITLQIIYHTSTQEFGVSKTLMGFSVPKSRGTGEPYFQQGNNALYEERNEKYI